jgi:hypothetical protein
MIEQVDRMPLIGEKAPAFVAESAQGTVHFPDEYKVATPANWQPGDDVIVPPPGSCGAADERVEKAGADYRCLDWFLCMKKDPGR